MSRMYYIAAEDLNGENQDQFVVANDTTEAEFMFMANMEFTRGDFSYLRIFEAPTDTTRIGIVDWRALSGVSLL